MKQEPMTKQRLKRYRRLKEEIERQLERLARIVSSLTSPSHTNMDGMPHSNFAADRTSAMIIKKIEIEEMYDMLILQSADEIKAIEDAISNIREPVEREVLRLRYIDGAEWADICGIIGYEEAQTYRIHGRALLRLLQDYDWK